MTELSWENLQTNTQHDTALFEHVKCHDDALALQPRLKSSISLFCKEKPNSYQSPILLVKAKESHRYLSLFTDFVNQHAPKNPTVIGSHCHVNGRFVTVSPAKTENDNFAATNYCLFSEWIEQEQLFGTIHQIDAGLYALHPGLIHKVNGGILMLSLRTLLAQPLLWFRLKNVLLTQQHHWFSADDNKTLPLLIPPIPIHCRLILVGDYASLSEFQEFEPELYQQALYAEFEPELDIATSPACGEWLSYLNTIANLSSLPSLDSSIYAPILAQATRECGDQFTVPLCPDWVTQLLRQTALFSQTNKLDKAAFLAAKENQTWREGYLSQRVLDDIYDQQILIQTQGECIGQINGLAVIEFPGHPQTFGEPTRISCVLQSGTGEFNDIEHRVELGGNLHAKGMMIMHAYVAQLLALDQQLPFSASLVFEQSYTEVDGDSASLAGLCAYLSALAAQPIDQQFAVTGSVDQFGNAQPIGGLNEKIEGFFNVCRHQGLTGQQGVLFPKQNQRHLCLNDDVVEAVKMGQFHLYPVENVQQAMEILTEMPFQGSEKLLNLVDIIHIRIQQAQSTEKRKSPRWLKWLLG